MKNTQTALDLPSLVRQRDYRRFLAIQTAPRQHRPALYALTAFANEMAHIPHAVKEPLAGFMRYAWWREALAEMNEGKPPRAHPLLQALVPLFTPESFVHLDAIITTGQLQLEDPDDATATEAREAALDTLWGIVLRGSDAVPLKLLKSLPLGQPIGPWKIFTIICKTLQP